MQLSILRRKGTRGRYAMPSSVTTDAKRILTCVGRTWNEAPFQMPPERTRKTGRTKSRRKPPIETVSKHRSEKGDVVLFDE